MDRKELPSINKQFPQMFLSQLGLTALAYLLIQYFDIPIDVNHYLSLKTWLLAIFAALITYIVILTISRSESSIGKAMSALSQKIQPMFAGLNWFKIIIIAMLAGISEELLFRGFLQTWIASKGGIELGILLSSLVFGLMHFINFSYFVFACIFGLALGIVYHLTNDILLVIYWHALYDLIAIAVLAKYPQVLGINKI